MQERLQIVLFFVLVLGIFAGFSVRRSHGFFTGFAVATSIYFLFCMAVAGGWELGGGWAMGAVLIAVIIVFLAYRKAVR